MTIHSKNYYDYFYQYDEEIIKERALKNKRRRRIERRRKQRAALRTELQPYNYQLSSVGDDIITSITNAINDENTLKSFVESIYPSIKDKQKYCQHVQEDIKWCRGYAIAKQFKDNYRSNLLYDVDAFYTDSYAPLVFKNLRTEIFGYLFNSIVIECDVDTSKLLVFGEYGDISGEYYGTLRNPPQKIRIPKFTRLSNLGCKTTYDNYRKEILYIYRSVVFDKPVDENELFNYDPKTWKYIPKHPEIISDPYDTTWAYPNWNSQMLHLPYADHREIKIKLYIDWTPRNVSTKYHTIEEIKKEFPTLRVQETISEEACERYRSQKPIEIYDNDTMIRIWKSKEESDGMLSVLYKKGIVYDLYEKLNDDKNWQYRGSYLAHDTWCLIWLDTDIIHYCGNCFIKSVTFRE